MEVGKTKESIISGSSDELLGGRSAFTLGITTHGEYRHF